MDVDGDATSSDNASDSDLEYHPAGYPGYFNSLAPAEEEEFEFDGWGGYDEVLDTDKPGPSRENMIRQLEEMIGPEQEAELWRMRNDTLSDKDRDNIRAFKLKMMSNMSRDAFEQMRYAFNHKLDISSEWAMLHRVAILSRVEPVWIHCCVKSCMAYTGDDTHRDTCRFCNEPRFTPLTGKPRRLFCYIPVIPRLQGYFQNPEMVKLLLYRHQYKHESKTIADVFDSAHYRTLRKKNVVVDGKTLPHKYFEGKYDIALGVCLDSYLLFKRNRGGPSATPILLKNYNLPPEIQTHLAHSICNGVIPGPHGPKDARSFLIPYDDELAQLAIGVSTFDSLTQTQFMLRAYNIFEMGDIIAIEKLLNIKGHNGLSPCRTCEIKGVLCNNIYYVPLTKPVVDGQPTRSWNPRNLPLRSHDSFAEVSAQLDNKDLTIATRKKLAQFHGIKGLPALRRVGSLHFGRSAPWDFMHLAFENIGPNLVKLWSGKYKGLDTGYEDYEISEETWELIWQETADAVRHIPADFVRVLQNNPAHFTAESWCFWFVYLAPILLNGRFRHQKYYTHACQFSEIIKSCIAFEITYTQIDELQDKIIDWVRRYEEYYYQYDADRLSACPLTIHGFLHIPDDIRFCGPSWSTWTFWMERFCGSMQMGLRSRRHPWANLNNRVLKLAYLEQLGARYDLDHELSAYNQHDKSKLSISEKIYDGYEQVILRVPYRADNTPNDITRTRVAGYISAAIGSASSPATENILRGLGISQSSCGEQIATGCVAVSGDSCSSGSLAVLGFAWKQLRFSVCFALGTSPLQLFVGAALEHLLTSQQLHVSICFARAQLRAIFARFILGICFPRHLVVYVCFECSQLITSHQLSSLVVSIACLCVLRFACQQLSVNTVVLFVGLAFKQFRLPCKQLCLSVCFAPKQLCRIFFLSICFTCEQRHRPLVLGISLSRQLLVGRAFQQLCISCQQLCLSICIALWHVLVAYNLFLPFERVGFCLAFQLCAGFSRKLFLAHELGIGISVGPLCLQFCPPLMPAALLPARVAQCPIGLPVVFRFGIVNQRSQQLIGSLEQCFITLAWKQFGGFLGIVQQRAQQLVCPPEQLYVAFEQFSPRVVKLKQRSQQLAFAFLLAPIQLPCQQLCIRICFALFLHVALCVIHHPQQLSACVVLAHQLAYRQL
ncbi:hypothetical protein MVEN_00772300 [Mycena venus]|uniref:Transposase family Tnp2 protein n=1 Tax=Mycena venus TaxID=2733690 RepID=A0A8H6YJX2_9AGAR|nr:hypothetical protein MVEN_00772300 [Mycena venus]